MSDFSTSCFHHDESRLFFLPHPALRSCIAHYTVSLAACRVDVPDTLSLIPDASGCLIFTPYPGGLESVFWGPTTKIVVVDNGPDEPPVRIFAEFLPGGAHRLLGFPLAELCDRQVDLRELDAALAARAEQVFSHGGMHLFPGASVLPSGCPKSALSADAEAVLSAKHPADSAHAPDPTAVSATQDQDIPSAGTAKLSDTCEPPFRAAGPTQRTADPIPRTAGLTQETADLPQQITGLTQWTANLSQQITGPTQRTTDLIQQTAGLTQETADLPQQITGLTQRTAGLIQQTAGLTQETSDLIQQTAGLTQRTAGLIQRTAGLTQQTSDLIQRIAGLTQQTTGLMQRTSSLTQWHMALSQWISGLDRLLLSRLHEDAAVPMAALLSHLHQNADRVCVQDLSAYTCYSQRQLSRIFSSQLGIGVKNYLRLLKINLAAQKLPLYRGNLAVLAQELGYFDQPHFIHDFKAVCGVTPTRYLSRLSDFYNETYKF